MLRQRGFILEGYAAIAAGVFVVLMLIALSVQTHRLDSCQREFATHVASVKALGEAQNAAAKRKDAEYDALMEKADEELARVTAERDAATKRMRDANPRPLELSRPAPATVRPDLACYDRAELERADGELTEEVRGGAAEGTARTDELNVGKRWAQSL